MRTIRLGIVLILVRSATSSLTINTTSGQLRGKLASGTSGVIEYLGIPYGYSCPANATFASKSELIAASGEFNFTKQAPAILQNLLEQPEVQYSEDCLTLNVWAKPPTNETTKPVLFWIHGGGFNTGTTNNTAYNGKHLADLEEVVVISANYRLNIFGFPGNPHITNNLGLLDQRLAVEWVRDNIAAFGGDPDRITIFGQSAGGSSVDYYSYAWTEDPIVAGFISDSGTVLSPNAQASESASADAWYNVTATLGCGDEGSDPDTLLICMRSLDWEDVQDAIPSSTGISSVTGSFGPTVDDIIVFSDYVNRSIAGNFIQRPLFIGSNNYEVGLFRAIFDVEGVTFSEAQWDYLNFVIYTCPASYRARYNVQNNIPTWRYRYFGEFPNLRLTTNPDSGAWHGSEVPLIFNTDTDIQNLVARTTAEAKIADYLRKAWVAFATDPEGGLASIQQYNGAADGVSG
ncbi:hypothetical protein UA08_06392 [Talaromyces atroroseus]|uniref:Carboxylic ester hydrolase n=1 Tax=Talaromyces atroroseus TaxID=1441469 RepID=A0A225ABA4_TALAT|nr:hypothetical protein UA08_06392 [Talaromyces atroroseus]OKL58232.1 hypothetical protein UA08_06392 [Talaromyces atroroseus]